MSTQAFWAIIALIWLAFATAMWRANEAVKRQDRERVAEVEAAHPAPRGWHATNNEGGHHPEARETADGRFRPGCTCRWDCLSRDPSSDIRWPTAGEATAEADRLLRERGAR